MIIHHHKPLIRVVLDCLGVHLAAPHIFHSQGQPFTILDFLFLQSLQADLLQFIVLGPDDLPSRVHRHGGLLPAQLDEDGPLIVAQGHIVTALDNLAISPTLKAILLISTQQESQPQSGPDQELSGKQN